MGEREWYPADTIPLDGREVWVSPSLDNGDFTPWIESFNEDGSEGHSYFGDDPIGTGYLAWTPVLDGDHFRQPPPAPILAADHAVRNMREAPDAE